MSKPKHSPEPWCNEVSDGLIFTKDATGSIILVSGDEDEYQPDRIVQCVNALAGIKDPAAALAAAREALEMVIEHLCTGVNHVDFKKALALLSPATRGDE